MTAAAERVTDPSRQEHLADRLSIDVIRRHLTTEVVGFQLHLCGEVSSTNTVLRRLADRGAREGTVVLAEEQTEGRGRVGVRWLSPAGSNAYVSVLFRPAVPLAAVPVFSFIAALALTDAIWSEGIAAGITWPNDIAVNGRKVAGCLGSYVQGRDGSASVILGAGVNVNIDRVALEAGLGPAAAHATSLREAAGHPVDRNRLVAAYLNALEQWWRAYRTAGTSGILKARRTRDVLAGRRVVIRSDGRSFRARVVGVNDDGRLVVEDSAGLRREVLNGEIRLEEAG
jgi:BirA family biotin operon repressor/biotin-[acetyl-CoA-carboxylase] ligase